MVRKMSGKEVHVLYTQIVKLPEFSGQSALWKISAMNELQTVLNSVDFPDKHNAIVAEYSENLKLYNEKLREIQKSEITDEEKKKKADELKVETKMDEFEKKMDELHNNLYSMEFKLNIGQLNPRHINDSFKEGFIGLLTELNLIG